MQIKGSIRKLISLLSNGKQSIRNTRVVKCSACRRSTASAGFPPLQKQNKVKEVKKKKQVEKSVRDEKDKEVEKGQKEAQKKSASSQPSKKAGFSFAKFLSPI